jgi:hypothetical protein
MGRDAARLPAMDERDFDVQSVAEVACCVVEFEPLETCPQFQLVVPPTVQPASPRYFFDDAGLRSSNGCHCPIAASLRPLLAQRRYGTIVATINITPPVNRT